MARINIEECWWTDPRRSALCRLIGDEELADGLMGKAWRLAQEFWKRDRKLVPKALFETLREASRILEVGLAEIRGDSVYIRGSSTYLDWVNSQKDFGSAGGKKSAESRRQKTGSAQPQPKKPRRPLEGPSKAPSENSKAFEASSSSSTSSSESFSDSNFKNIEGHFSNDPSTPVEEPFQEALEGISGLEKTRKLSGQETPTGKTWEAYKNAFFERYGHDPVRNTLVNSQIQNFVKRIGIDDSPFVAKFYLTHSKRYYVENRHPVGMLLKDAEALYSQWKTGTKVTSSEAISAEKTDFYKNQLQQVREGLI